LNGQIPNQQVLEDTYYSFVIDQNLFTDIDVGDLLTLSAKLSDGNSLPAWLAFDPVGKVFTGTPGNNDVGILNITVSATDNQGASVSDVFKLEAINVNDAPVVNGQISNQEVPENSYYSYFLDHNLFSDIDLGDQLTITVKLVDGNELPTWLTFNENSYQLSGIAKNPGDLLIAVIATDKSGASASVQFSLRVTAVLGIENLDTLKFSIYPNPTAGSFYINANKQLEHTEVLIRDNRGRLILRQKLLGSISEFNLKGYSPGVYYIELFNGKEKKTFKIVRQ
jgi:hypothetical protein